MVIKAIIFDLDGTLVQTEVLKAMSYAKAARELSPWIKEERVIEAFKQVVGRPREEVAKQLLFQFHLEEPAKKKMISLSVKKPWEAFVKIRLRFYDDLLTDPRVLKDNICGYNISLLGFARRTGFKTALATMSKKKQVEKILHLLGLEDKFDLIVTREDLKKGKPDPEVYDLIAGKLSLSPQECLVIEDAPSGVQAALAAKMHCIVVTNSFTKQVVHDAKVIDERWIVDDRAQLAEVTKKILKEQGAPESLKVEVETGAKSC